MATSNDRFGDPSVHDDDRLPWLESADDDYRDGPAWSMIAVLVAIGLLLTAGIVFALYQYNHPAPDSGTGAVIAAPVGDYKVKPDEPGGMRVDGEGDAALATSQGGAAGNAAINLNAAPETPIAGRKAGPSEAPTAATGAIAVPGSGGRLVAARPGATPAATTMNSAGGALVQLGSFPNAADANAEWTVKAKRFGYLAALGKSVEQAEVNGRTVYRLRVNAGSAGAAQTLCGKLKVAGEACFIPN